MQTHRERNTRKEPNFPTGVRTGGEEEKCDDKIIQMNNASKSNSMIKQE